MLIIKIIDETVLVGASADITGDIVWQAGQFIKSNRIDYNSGKFCYKSKT